jgi:hypothetical protein
MNSISLASQNGNSIVKYSKLIVCKHNEQQDGTKITIAFYSFNIINRYKYKCVLRTVWFDMSHISIIVIGKDDKISRSHKLYRRLTVYGCL